MEKGGADRGEDGAGEWSRGDSRVEGYMGWWSSEDTYHIMYTHTVSVKYGTATLYLIHQQLWPQRGSETQTVKGYLSYIHHLHTDTCGFPCQH